MCLQIFIEFVIDNEETWGEYPLAQMALGDPDYPLLYQEVLSGCRHGNDIYTVLNLEQNNLSVSNYHPVTKTLVSIVYCVVWNLDMLFVVLE